MNEYALLLSEPINFAVVQLPDRKYPGVVCHGDTLNALVKDLESMLVTLKDGNLVELKDQINSMREMLEEAKSFYESVCEKQKIRLPYVK